MSTRKEARERDRFASERKQARDAERTRRDADRRRTYNALLQERHRKEAVAIQREASRPPSRIQHKPTKSRIWAVDFDTKKKQSDQAYGRSLIDDYGEVFPV